MNNIDPAILARMDQDRAELNGLLNLLLDSIGDGYAQGLNYYQIQALLIEQCRTTALPPDAWGVLLSTAVLRLYDKENSS